MFRILFLLLFSVSAGFAGDAIVLQPEIPEGVQLRHRRRGAIEVTVPGGREEKTVIRLAKLELPPVGNGMYAIQGEVSYSKVEGTAFLELWNHFPGKGALFSRTLSRRGPTRGFSEAESWRPFLLPFPREGSPNDPSIAELNLVFPKGGSVTLRRVRLEKFPNPVDLATLLSKPLELEPFDEDAWWTPPQAVVGGLLWSGVLLLLMLFIGRLKEHEAALYHQKINRVIVWTAGVGGALVLAGVVAAGLEQLSAVQFPLWGLGVLQILIALRLGQRLRMTQQMVKLQAELREMGALSGREEAKKAYPKR